MNADGTIERTDDGRYVIDFKRRLDHPVERVWAALTEPDELLAWWGHVDVELREGGRFDVRWLNSDDEGNTIEMHSRIARLVPGELLVLDGDRHGLLRWELTPDGNGTLLAFRSTVALQPGFLTRVPAGWHFHLDALADHLGGGSTDLVGIPSWEPIHAAYEAKLT